MDKPQFDIYFDNAATTRVSEQALAAAVSAMRGEYGNPSSAHGRGAAAFHALNMARQTMANILQAQAEEVFFTSGGTEANNSAIFGAAQAANRQRKGIIVSAGEHPSVLEPVKYLANKGYELKLIPLLPNGIIDLDGLKAALNCNTILVSMMHVNNETGAVQPLTEIGTALRELSPGALFHIDGVQSFARLPLDLHAWQADAFTASGHKLNAPKGVGLLWLKRGRRLPPLLRGGGQERDFRSGTENMPGILAFARAAEICAGDFGQQAAHLREIKNLLIQSLLNALPDVVVNGPAAESAAPHILNISFLGVRSELLLHYLEARGIYVSAGSACNSRSSKGSHVLQAMNLAPERVDSALRFSFCRENTLNEVKTAVPLIAEAVRELRALTGRRQGGR